MTVAALVISIVALLVAAAPAEFARRQANAAGHSARIEADRRHDEQAPRFTALAKRLNEGDDSYWRLHLHLETPLALSEVEVRMLNAPVGVQFTPGVLGVSPDERAPVHRAHAVAQSGVALAPLRRVTWQVEANEASGELVLEVRAVAGREPWLVAVPVEGFTPLPRIDFD